MTVATFLLALAASAPAPPAHPDGYQYLSPRPGSQHVSPANNVVFRQGSPLDRASVGSAIVSVVGRVSGDHPGRLVVSDDGRTLVFLPERPFAPGEEVTASLAGGVRAQSGEALPPVSFGFTVAPRRDAGAISGLAGDWLERFGLGARAPSAAAAPPAAPAGGPIADDPCPSPLPAGYLGVTIQAANDPGPDPVFLSMFGGARTALMIADEKGGPLYFRTFSNLGFLLDFKLQPTGLLTFCSGSTRVYYSMDSTYAILDSFAVGNGYGTDIHDLQLLPDGHALLIGEEAQPVDMSAVVPGGNPNAIAYGAVVQELDADHNVIFQWRSFGSYQITDCTSPLVPLTDSLLDDVHANAVELDHDGNLLFSARHMDEITKIDRGSGDLIWRLGPAAVNNEFTFLDDQRTFSHQHDIRRLPNGNITLYDNGNYLSPQVSRAVEYQLDEVAKTATLVWEYHRTPEIYGGFMGNVQRRENGHTVIGWGGTFPATRITDVAPDGSTALEMSVAPGYFSYRGFRFPWHTTRFAPEQDSLEFGAIEEHAMATLPVVVRNTCASDVTINCLFVNAPRFTADGPIPATLAPGDSMTITVTYQPGAAGDHAARLYVRQVSDSELVARTVELHGAAYAPVAAPEPGALTFALATPTPNPCRSEARISYTLPRAETVSLALFDVHGRRVETLASGPAAAGRHDFAWRPKGLSSGLYFLRLRAGENAAVARVVIAN